VLDLTAGRDPGGIPSAPGRSSPERRPRDGGRRASRHHHRRPGGGGGGRWRKVRRGTERVSRIIGGGGKQTGGEAAVVPFHPMAYLYMVHNCNRPAGAESLCVELPRGHARRRMARARPRSRGAAPTRPDRTLNYEHAKHSDFHAPDPSPTWNRRQPGAGDVDRAGDLAHRRSAEAGRPATSLLGPMDDALSNPRANPASLLNSLALLCRRSANIRH